MCCVVAITVIVVIYVFSDCMIRFNSFHFVCHYWVLAGWLFFLLWLLVLFWLSLLFLFIYFFFVVAVNSLQFACVVVIINNFISFVFLIMFKNGEELNVKHIQLREFEFEVVTLENCALSLPTKENEHEYKICVR